MATQFIKDFNQLLECLIQQVTPMTGNNYHFLFTKLIKINALLPIQTFHEYAHSWKKQIEKRDETFFLDENTAKSVAKDGEDLSEVFKLTGIWKTLDDDSKNNLWEIFNGLLILSEQYHDSKI
jgi:hypothetical protein